MNKVVLISGGSDGLGRAVARELVPSCSVVILAHNRERTERVAQELSCDFEACDVARYDQVDRAVGRVLGKYGKIDCLINNAGVWIEGELETNEIDQIERAFRVNTLGTIYLSKAVIPFMKEQKDGLILNVISQAGLYGKSGRTVYNATKFAITGFTKSLELELAPYNIRVTGLYPGKLDTKLFEKAGIAKNKTDALSVEPVAKLVRFILTFNSPVEFPEVGIKHCGQI